MTPVKPKRDAAEREPIGEIKPARTLFFRESVGEATDQDGNKYEMSTSVGGGAPIVHSSKSGRWFVLSWTDIVRLAVEAGIDEPDPESLSSPRPKKRKA